ncbi:hypothetical protein STEG23_028996, partial [Scotinomys teguina]
VINELTTNGGHCVQKEKPVLTLAALTTSGSCSRVEKTSRDYIQGQITSNVSCHGHPNSTVQSWFGEIERYFACMYVYVPHVCIACGDQKRASEPLQLELEKVVS